MVPPPPGEESQIVILPPGWQSYLSPQGRRYYVNTNTNGESRSGGGRVRGAPWGHPAPAPPPPGLLSPSGISGNLAAGSLAFPTVLGAGGPGPMGRGVITGN